MAGAGQHAPPSALRVASNAESKRDLTSWWKGFKRGNNKVEEPKVTAPGIFGVPLQESVRYANVAISLFNDEGKSYIYGYVPIVVAKCGVFLKDKATETEGIFRLAGSEKRIKELRTAFDSPDRYGKNLDWTGYTVHDAANVLRRYFNQLPEPIIPLTFYERFRDPLRSSVNGAAEGHHFDLDAAIRAYQGLITEVPPLNRQLLLYILDLLAVFAAKSETNKMTTPNLAAIFQPGILSHPQHDMAPQEYRLSQDVLIFLIENQDSFLIGMRGTAADENTVKQVQEGYKPPSDSPIRTKTAIQRSASNASAGSQGARKFSGIRRNVSTSSRTPSNPSSPQIGSPALGGGIHRSNTVPSQRQTSSPRFNSREKTPEPSTPRAEVPALSEPVVGAEATEPEDSPETPAAVPPAIVDITSASSSEATTPLAAPGNDNAVTAKERPDAEPRAALLSPEVAAKEVPHGRSGSRTFLDIFKNSPGSEQEQRTPRKLRKKRAPGGSVSSAHSSINDVSQEYGSPKTPQRADYDHPNEADASLSPGMHAGGLGSPYMSEQSRASVTDISDVEGLDEGGHSQERNKRWRFSNTTKSRQASDAGSDMVKSTIPSSETNHRSESSNSASMPSAEGTTLTEQPSETDERKKGPISWIRGKLHDRKDKDVEKRAKSPMGASQHSESRDSIAAEQAVATTSPEPVLQEVTEETDKAPGQSIPGTPTPTPSTAKMETLVEAPAAEEDATVQKEPAVVIEAPTPTTEAQVDGPVKE